MGYGISVPMLWQWLVRQGFNFSSLDAYVSNPPVLWFLVLLHVGSSREVHSKFAVGVEFLASRVTKIAGKIYVHFAPAEPSLQSDLHSVQDESPSTTSLSAWVEISFTLRRTSACGPSAIADWFGAC